MSLLLALSSVTALLFQSDQLTPATTLALETKWCHMFGFLNHWYDNGIIPFIAKATQQWAKS